MRFIVVDGLDGSGKDTHAGLIKQRYEKMGERVVVRSHPESDNYFGRRAKEALLGSGKVNKLKAAVFYMFDVLRSIRKFYYRKDIDTLIMVRYLIGTAYLPGKLASIGYRFFLGFVPTSRYMFFLDAPPDMLLGRFRDREHREMFENLDDLVRVREKALGLVYNWYIIDVSGSVDDAFSRIESVLDMLDSK